MSLKKLSAQLGLSQTTVSRALNGYPEVSEATRERVLQAAAKSNYSPNQRAVSLATGRAMAVSHVVPIAPRQNVVNPIMAEFIAGASQTYKEMGYELTLTFTAEEDAEDIYRTLASKRSVDGFVVHSPVRNDPRIKLLNDIGLPFVVNGRVADSDESYSWIDVDDKRSFQRATKLLIDLGHERIALINGNEELTYAWHRKLGYRQALGEVGMEFDESIEFSTPLTETIGYSITRDLIETGRMPTAMLVSSYIVALGVRRALADHGLRIGNDVSVITHDDDLSYFDNAGAFPQFTSTRFSAREVGLKGAKMLLDLIAKPDKGPQQKLVEAQLIMGSSTSPVS